MSRINGKKHTHTHTVYVCMYVCMVITYSKRKDQPGKVANSARGQLNRENEHFSVPVSRQRIWPRETGSAVPSLVSLLILHTQADSGAYSRDSSRFPRRRQFIYLKRHPPSGQSRVYRVTQLRTGGVHCRESTGTGPGGSPQGSSIHGCCFFKSYHGTPLSFPISYPLLTY